MFRRDRQSHNEAPGSDLDILHTLPAELDKYLPLAQSIAQRVDQMVETVDSSQFDQALDEIIEGLTKEERGRRLADLFASLPLEQKLELLQVYFDDEELTDLLQKEKRKVLESNRTLTYIQILAEKAAKVEYVDLEEVEEGSIVDIELYVRDAFEEARTFEDLASSDFVRRIHGVTVKKGDLEVLSDSYPRKGWTPVPSLSRHQIVEMGAWSAKGQTRNFKRRLFFGAEIDCVTYPRKETKTEMYDSYSNSRYYLVTGRVSVNQEEVMGANMEHVLNLNKSNRF
jgi:hypothetical protein